MKTTFALIVCGGMLSIPIGAPSAPVMRVVKSTQPGATLLHNGDFEQLGDGKPAGWNPAPKGCQLAAGEGRNGSRALVGQNTAGDAWSGASQTLALNQTEAAPLVVRGWSKAEKVNGSPDSGYSLYVDLLYADGTPLWGQTANFRCGTHDWQQREFVLLPEKPVKSLTLHCIFRGHTGKVWFDDVAVEEIKTQGGAVLFQGVPVQAPQPAKINMQIPAQRFETRDGLRLAVRGSAIASLQIGGRELAAASPSGFLARDVAANSDVYVFDDGGACPELGLKVQAEVLSQDDHLVVQGRLSDTTGKDRAITLIFALPVDATNWRWGDDIRHERVIQGRGEFANQVMVRCGATGAMSLYPLAAIHDERRGLALAIDMAQPAQYRLVYHAGTKQFLIAYDFGLVPETERFPGSADFRFVLYRFDPAWGFRAAFQKLATIFDYFVVRSREQGIWMPFTDVSKVEGWQDFGFRYHEGNNNVPWDDEHGVLSFRYTEPMTWWMPMKKEIPRTEAEALRVRDELATSANNSQARMAQVSKTAGMLDEEGKPCLMFQDAPWCNGVVWSLNPNPYLSGATASADESDKGRLKAGLQTNAATVHWSKAIKQQLYGPDAKGRLDGEYLDSLEGYVTADLNFRREHFRFSTVPLTFASDTKRPALFKGLAVFEFTKWMADDLHRSDKLSFANGVPYRFTFLCPWLDVMGTETDWLQGGKYRPSPETQMNLWRTMSGQKPYLLLMNTDYDAFTPDLVEKYFQRSLFYGMFPGMFSHNAADHPYWQNPKWYNRDRPLFKKYLPLVKRVAEAGWQPVTEARCDNAKILVERFGPGADGAIYFTLFNDSTEPQSGTLSVSGAAFPKGESPAARELLSSQPVSRTGTGWPVQLKPQEAAVIQLAKSPR